MQPRSYAACLVRKYGYERVPPPTKKGTTTTAAHPDLEALAIIPRSDLEVIYQHTTSQEAKFAQQQSHIVHEHSLPAFPHAKQWDARLPHTQLNPNCCSSGPAIKCLLPRRMLPLHLRMSSATARETSKPSSQLRASLLLVLVKGSRGTHRPGKVSAG